MQTMSKDIFILTIIMIATVIFSKLFVNFNIPPFEDAAMLMRYAENFSLGYGIVWNINEQPIDGATDFLFMIVLGLLVKSGIDIEAATKAITILSHFLTIAVIYIGNRKFYSSSTAPAVISSIYFALGPGLFLSAAYFGTSFFALFIALTWLVGLNILFKSVTNNNLITFSLLSLITGLIRPEGVIISTFMFIALAVMLDRNTTKKLFIYFSGTFFVLGGTYFIWRWNYFGYPFPNPFYKKGGGGLYWDSLYYSIKNTLKFSLPFIIFFILGYRDKKLKKLTIALSIPIIGSSVIWILLSNEMNFGSRFQYPILPLILLSWAPILFHINKYSVLPKLLDFNFKTRFSIFITITFIGIIISIQSISTSKITYNYDGRYDVALLLKKYSDSGYTIATTEAGLLPFYSKWNAIDTWGLNDSWIAHNNGISQQYLNKLKPDIIVWHGDFSPNQPSPVTSKKDKWFQMVAQLNEYAERNNYILAAVFGIKPNDVHYYYISPTLAVKDKIISEIRSIKYTWFANGKKSNNFALK